MIKSACDCCGTCCRNGGPALHTGDRGLVESGFLGFADIITIRKGEYILDPISDEPYPAGEEFLKIQGKGADWCCKFLDNESLTCTMYQNRPFACRLLKCWNPEDVLEIAGKELVTRFDFIPAGEPVSKLMKKHDDNCPVPDIAMLRTRLFKKTQREETLAALTGLVNRDLQVRSGVVRQFRLALADELFFFGRPIFQLLLPVGISVVESAGGLSLKFSNI